MKKYHRPARILGPGVVLALAAVLALTGCSRNKEAVAVSLITVPSTVTVGQSVKMTARVSHDSSDAGVDWSAGGGSGTFAPAHTASGALTVYTAPATPGPVTIVAAATADGTAQASLVISVVPAAGNAQLQGTYVFFVQGENSTGLYAAAGTIVADGNGLITAGEQDYADEARRTGPDALTGSYAIGPDGRGSLMLDAANGNLPQGGLETFSVAVVSPSHALLIQFDGTASSSGSLDLQAPSALDPAAIDGAFAFTTQGVDIANQVPIGRGGVLTLSAAAGTVTAGSYFENDGGSTFSSATTGTITAPDAFGRGTLDLTAGVSYAYYAVKGQVLRLVESGLPTFVTSGSLFGQGDAGLSATFSDASLNGDFVFSAAGGTGFGALALAGQFLADGAGSFTTGAADLNNGGVTTVGAIAGPSRYSIAGSGVGTLSLPPAVDQLGSVAAFQVFLVDPAINLLDPNNPSGGGGALVMDFDTGAVSSGQILPQSPAALDGDYAIGLQDVATSGETDWVGRAVSASGAFTGVLDVNETGLFTAGAALTGAVTADSANVGRFTGTLTGNGLAHHITLYQVNASRVVFVDTDGSDIGAGLLEKQ